MSRAERRAFTRENPGAVEWYEKVVARWGREPLAWATYVYACSPIGRPTAAAVIGVYASEGHGAQKGCGYEELRYLAPGVEGPKVGPQSECLYIPCSMFAGTCPRCGSAMSHVRWNEEQHFDPPIRVPEGSAYFYIPEHVAEQASLYQPDAPAQLRRGGRYG